MINKLKLSEFISSPRVVSFAFFIFLLNFSTVAQQMNIGILNDKNPQKFLVEPLVGKYIIKSEGKKICKLKKDNALIINYLNGTLNISNEKKDYGLHTSLEIMAKKYKFNKSHDIENSRKNAELNIKLIAPELKARTYQGNIRVIAKEKNIIVSNQIAMPDYLAGVVETESGSKCELEYYKNQAIICRTYATKKEQDHKKDAYDLCDGVHCQAYKGKSTSNPLIQKAVKETNELVIVDKDGKLISAVFSANCGGQTNNSEDVWSSAVTYLKSIKDTYCTDQPQAFWTKKIAFADFKNFLKEKKLNFSDTLSIDSFAFTQPERKIMYTVARQEIKLSTLRLGLGLRSTFFEIKPDGDNLIFSGRGYGHGVGMCQEGAMNMARKGNNFEQIIKYYYKDVNIVPLSKVKN
jgi:stage II sporulation protein D